uniref:Uncharacterized protein n=1 Tax=Lepeophtheirus salmonis TaxID=72036 RepID=A0A0K2VEK8_LEPSM
MSLFLKNSSIILLKAFPVKRAVKGYVMSMTCLHLEFTFSAKLRAFTVNLVISRSWQYKAPIKAPILTPAIRSIGIPASNMDLIIPTCEQPLAPPPPRTKPTDVPVNIRASLEKSENISIGILRLNNLE